MNPQTVGVRNVEADRLGMRCTSNNNFDNGFWNIYIYDREAHVYNVKL